MVVIVKRHRDGWQGAAVTAGGVVLLRLSGRDWFTAWWRVGRVLGLLRVRYSLQVKA